MAADAAPRSASASGPLGLTATRPAMTSPSLAVYLVRLVTTRSAWGRQSALNADTRDGSRTSLIPWLRHSAASAATSGVWTMGFVGTSAMTPAIEDPRSAKMRPSPARSMTSRAWM